MVSSSGSFAADAIHNRQNTKDKNPSNKFGKTPLHMAATNGHLDICRLIIDNVENKHPINIHVETPKNLADRGAKDFGDRYGHVQISKLFDT